MRMRLQFPLLFAAVLGFLLLTGPQNHSEAEDAYFYARMVEQGTSAELFHMHHLLYLPVMKGLYAVAGMLGYAGRALPLLIGFSMVCGALAVCFFFLLSGRGRRGVLFSAALLFSYGFWRYSTTAEIYIPVTMLSMAALLCLRRTEARPLLFWTGAACAALALLMHVIAWPLVLVSLPLYLMVTQRTRPAVVYLVFVLAVVAAVYLFAISGPGLTVYSDEQALRDTLMSPQAWVKGAVAWGQNIGSGNFLFAISPVAEKIQAFFPYHMLQEELFMGKTAPGWVRCVAPVTFVAVVSGMIIAVFAALRNVRYAFKRDWPWMLAVLIWFGGVSVTAWIFEPANPEMWIASLAPFWLLLGSLLNSRPSTRAARWVPPGLALILLVHNAIGGISLVASPESDYCRQKAEWIVENASAGDWVVVADSHSFSTCLRYYSPVGVVDAKFQGLETIGTGRVFVYDDVLNPLPAVSARAPESVARLKQTAEELRASLVPVHTNRFGVIYEWMGRSPELRR